MLIRADALLQILKDLPPVESVEESVYVAYVQGPDVRIKVSIRKGLMPGGKVAWVVDVPSAIKVQPHVGLKS